MQHRIAPQVVDQTFSPPANLSVLLDLDCQEKRVEITISGALLGEQTQSLRVFLKNLVKYYHGSKWILRVDHLEIINGKSLLLLKKFARVLSKRGQVVEIVGMPPYFQAMLYDLKLHRYFVSLESN